MPKVVFFFAGTFRKCDEYRREHEYLEFDDDVIRVYVSGCQERGVGRKSILGKLSAYIWPDLDIATKNVDEAFIEQGKDLTLDLNALKSNFGNSLIIDVNKDSSINLEQPVVVEGVVFEGYSRGAVTTYAMAKKLDPKFQATSTKMEIIANQPVTGESAGHAALFEKYHDLSACKSVNSVTTFYAMHDNDYLVSSYYTTMRPKTNPTAKTTDVLLPQQIHKRSTTTAVGDPNPDQTLRQLGLVHTPAPFHIAKTLAEHNYARISDKEVKKMEAQLLGLESPLSLPLFKGTQNPVQQATACAQAWYLTQKHYFTPYAFSQTIFGTSADYRAELTESIDYLNLKITMANALLTNKLPLIDDGETIKNAPEKYANATKAIAVLAIHDVFEEGDTRDAFLDYLALDAPEINVLCDVIKNITHSCTHLTDRAKVKHSSDFKKHKFNKIETHSRTYKESVFNACLAYLKDPQKMNFDDLKNTLYAAEKTFAKQALSYDRATYAKWFRPLTKVIWWCLSKPAQKAYDFLKPFNAEDHPNNKVQGLSKQSLFAIKSEKLARKTTHQIIESMPLPGKK